MEFFENFVSRFLSECQDRHVNGNYTSERINSMVAVLSLQKVHESQPGVLRHQANREVLRAFTLSRGVEILLKDEAPCFSTLILLVQLLETWDPTRTNLSPLHFHVSTCKNRGVFEGCKRSVLVLG